MLEARTSPADPRPTRQPSPTPAPGRPAGRFAPLRKGERICLDLKDADLRDVLRTFATFAHCNLAIDPEVRGTVTVRLTDVAWEQALDVILRSNGLAADGSGTVVRVGTPASLAPTRGQTF